MKGALRNAIRETAACYRMYDIRSRSSMFQTFAVIASGIDIELVSLREDSHVSPIITFSGQLLK
jgi:hypothetical protein